MRKSKAARIAGFAIALGATASLVGVAAGGTGAYFTDTHNGQITAGTGDVKVNTSDLNLDFANMLPGQVKTDPISYQATGTAPEDIWLAIPAGSPLNAMGGSAAALGRYGHFEIDSNAGSFVSNNLASQHSGDTSTTDICSVNANGHGGSSAAAANASDYNVPFCPVPQYILLDTNLAYGDTGTAQLSFGYTKLLANHSQQDLPDAQITGIQVIATQHGIRPDDPNSDQNNAG